MVHPLKETGSTRFLGAVALLVMIALGVILGAMCLSLLAGSRSFNFGSCFMLGASSIVLFLSLRALFSVALFGTPRLLIPTPSVCPGEPFQLRYSQATRRRRDVGVVILSLVFRETIRYREDEDAIKTNKSEKVVWCETAPPEPGRAESTIIRDFTLCVPAGEMPTFIAPNNQLQWFIQVATRLPGWSDYTAEYEVIVSPGGPLVLHPEQNPSFPSLDHVGIFVDTWEPDGIVRGAERGILAWTVEFTPGVDLYCQLRMRIGWHTADRGDRDSRQIRELFLHQGDLPGGAPTTIPFHVWLPREPIPYEGSHIRILWTITIEVDAPGPDGRKTEYHFSLGPSVLLTSPPED